MNTKRIFYIFLSFVLIISVFCGCGGETEDMKTAPGTLVGIHYNRTNGSVANDEFHIYVTPYSFSAEYWPENPEEWVKDEDIPVWYMTEKKEKITEEQWKEIEETVLAVYPELIGGRKKEVSFFDKLISKFIKEPMILDGGDSQDFSLDWMLEDGSIISEKFGTPQGNNGVRLYWLLCELADPIGREIPELIITE